MRSAFLRRALAALLVLLALCTALCGCAGRRAPALEEVYDEIVALIEASHDINDVMFGQGLPVWTFDSDFALEHHLYNDSDGAYYQYVTDEAPYLSIWQLQEAISAVYSASYAAALFETLFDGFALGTTIVRPQYIEQNGYLMQRTDYAPILTERRVYDYETMHLIRSRSNEQLLTIEIQARGQGESEFATQTLILVKETEGWRLDSPTY